MLSDNDIYEWLQRALNLKNEKGLRASIRRLTIKMLDEKEEMDRCYESAVTYQNSSLEFLKDILKVNEPYSGINKTTNIDTIY